MFKRLLCIFVLSVLLSGLLIAVAQDVTTTDQDGMTLYKLCYADAKTLMIMGKNSSDTISIIKNGNITKFQFTEHVLSCGTHMNGIITEEKKNNLMIITGDFDVTHNPYKINKLLIHIVNNPQDKTITGTLTIDDKEVDVNLLK